jgi:hypothetical protein
MENSKESSIVSLLQEIDMLNRIIEDTQKKLEETQKKLKISEGQTTMFRNKFKRIKRERDAYT